MPAFLQEGSQEVERHHNVGLEFVISHLDVTAGSGQARDLLKLELNGGTGVNNLLGEGFLVGDNGGETLDSGENGSDDNGHLLEHSVGSEKKSILLGPLLDELLVLVELFEFIERGHIDVKVV